VSNKKTISPINTKEEFQHINISHSNMEVLKDATSIIISMSLIGHLPITGIKIKEEIFKEKYTYAHGVLG
jgi:hypothetical protein